MINVIKKGISLLRNKNVRIFLKIYEPFIYSLCLAIISLTYTIDYIQDGNFITQEDYQRRMFILSLIGGCSLPTILRIISYSGGLCFWYMFNVACLLLNNLNGLLYFLNVIDSCYYLFIGTGLGCAGVISFLIFKIFYRITDEVFLHHIE